MKNRASIPFLALALLACAAVLSQSCAKPRTDFNGHAIVEGGSATPAAAGTSSQLRSTGDESAAANQTVSLPDSLVGKYDQTGVSCMLNVKPTADAPTLPEYLLNKPAATIAFSLEANRLTRVASLGECEQVLTYQAVSASEGSLKLKLLSSSIMKAHIPLASDDVSCSDLAKEESLPDAIDASYSMKDKELVLSVNSPCDFPAAMAAGIQKLHLNQIQSYSVPKPIATSSPDPGKSPDPSKSPLPSETPDPSKSPLPS